MANQTRDAVTRYAAFLPEPERAVLLAACMFASDDASPAKEEAGTITTPAPPATVMTNKKIWDDSKLKALWEQSIMPGVTITSLAKKHGVSRQRIATLIQTAKKKFSTNNSWQNSHSPLQNRFVKGSNY